MIKGIIIRSVSGFYYVEAADKVYECKARGNFRKKGIKPIVGDHVIISEQQNGYCAIDEVCERRNFIIRPPISNIDQMIIVVSTCEPKPNMLIIDKMTAAAVSKGIEPIVVFSKSDLSSPEELIKIYRMAGIKAIEFSSVDKRGRDEIISLLPNKVTSLTGNSGVGKSTLINTLFPELDLDTGNISEKLGRGRHTTRTVELFKCRGGYIADTPGFSTLDIERYELIEKEKLPEAFPEFGEYIGKCRFSTCSHTCEKGCAVIDAVESGVICRSRHESYKSMYNEVKDLKKWMQLKDAAL